MSFGALPVPRCVHRAVEHGRLTCPGSATAACCSTRLNARHRSTRLVLLSAAVWKLLDGTALRNPKPNPSPAPAPPLTQCCPGSGDSLRIRGWPPTLRCGSLPAASFPASCWPAASHQLCPASGKWTAMHAAAASFWRPGGSPGDDFDPCQQLRTSQQATSLSSPCQVQSTNLLPLLTWRAGDSSQRAAHGASGGQLATGERCPIGKLPESSATTHQPSHLPIAAIRRHPLPDAAIPMTVTRGSCS